MTRDARDIIVGLDIGTSKVTCIVAQPTDDNRFSVIGFDTEPTSGLKRGVVVNIEATVEAISRVLQSVEAQGNFKIHEVYTCIAGSHIRSVNAHGMVPIKDREVTRVELQKVIDVARAVQIPAEQQILHILTQEFIIDGHGGIREPLGMSGVKLEVKVHIVTGAQSAAHNVIKCVRRCGLEVHDLVLQSLAASASVLSEDERELGVCLIDIGGGTTDIAVFSQGAIRHTAVIPVAGDQITNDIAMALHTPTAEAEELKIRYGVAMGSLVEPDQMIEVPGVGERAPRRLSVQRLADVIEPRVEELFELVQGELRRSGYEDLLSSGVVLTGGTAALRGICEQCEEVLHLPARVGVPGYRGPLAEMVAMPRFAAAMGLVEEALVQRRQGVQAREQRSVRQWLGRVRAWIEQNF